MAVEAANSTPYLLNPGAGAAQCIFRGSILHKSGFAAAAAAVFGLWGAANAATITVLPSGIVDAPLAYSDVATFDDIVAQAYGSQTASGDFTDGGGLFSGSGIVMNNGGGGSLGLYATPFGDSTNYMAVLGGGSEQISYPGFSTSFGLYWGSLDSYNSIAFYNNGDLVATVSGADVPSPAIANGGQSDPSSNRYVLITSLPSFNVAILSSSSNSFEFDNVIAGLPRASANIAAAPEPATWAMMLLGFLGLGFVGARARKGASMAAAG